MPWVKRKRRWRVDRLGTFARVTEDCASKTREPTVEAAEPPRGVVERTVARVAHDDLAAQKHKPVFRIAGRAHRSVDGRTGLADEDRGTAFALAKDSELHGAPERIAASTSDRRTLAADRRG